MSSGHSLYSPSSLTRRFFCLGSANAESGMPDTSNEAAAEGTAAHTIRERCLVENKDVEDFIGTVIEVENYEFTCTREWARLLQPGIDWLRDKSRKKKAKLYFEYRVPLEIWMPGESGTLDAAVVSPELIIINDLKFGRNWVDAYENEQMSAYALGFIATHVGFDNPDRKVLLTIDQPRAFGGGSEWETTIRDLLVYGKKMAKMFIASKNPNAKRTASIDGCTYCKAAMDCREFAEYLLGLFGLDFEDDFMIPKAERLGVDQLGKLLEHRSLIVNAMNKYADHAKSLILDQAIDVPGVKVVDSGGTRIWADESEVETWLLERYKKHQVFKTELMSPPQLENVLGTRNWAKVQEFIETKPGNPLLVKASDPRPALIPVINLFDDDSFSDDEDVLGLFSDDFSDII